MESTPDSDQVTPAVLPVTSIADMEMSSDIDMASEMDLTAGVDFNNTLDVNHLLGIDAVSAATEHTGADLDAEAMFSSVSSTTGLLEDSMGMVDMSCSQSSRASDVQGIVAMKIDNSSCDATPLMSTRSSALSLQDSTSDLFPIDFPSGLGIDDSSTTDMIATKGSGENVATGEEQNNGGKISNNYGNVAVKESQECEAVDMDETNICAGHMSTAKELDGQTVSPVEVSDTSSPLDLTVSNNTSNEQNSDFQMTSDCGNKVMASCTEDGRLVDVQIASDRLKVSPATLTVECLSTETDPVVPKVAPRKRKQVAAVGQRRSTRLKPCITDDPSPSLVKGGPEEAKCIEGDNVDDVLIQDESAKDESGTIEPAKEGPAKDIPSGDALLETVPTSKESVKGTVGLGPFEDSVVVSSPATTRNVARRGKRRHLGGRPVKARRNAKRQQIMNEDADSKTTTEISPSAPVLDKEQVLTVDGKNSALALQLQVSMEEDTVQNDSQISKDKDTKTDGDSGQTHVNVEKTEVIDTPDQTCATVSVASSDTVEYSGVLPDMRQQEFTDEPMAQTSDTISSAANSEQHVVDVGTSGQTLVETTSSIWDTDAVVGSRDHVVGSMGELAGSCEAAVEDEVVGGQAGQIITETESSSGDIPLEPKDVAVESIAVEPVISRSEIPDNVAQATVHSGKEESAETATSSVVTEDRSAEEKGIETNARTEAVDQETKSTLCPGCSGNCTTPVKLSCSHVVCERCTPPEGGTATPQACPVCKSGNSADGSGETDPAAVAESDNAGNTQTETVILEGEGGTVLGFLPTRRPPLLGLRPKGPILPTPSEDELVGPGPPHPFRGPYPDCQPTFGPPPFRGPRPNCPPPPFRGPCPRQGGPPRPRGLPPPIRGPCPRPHGPPHDFPHSRPDGPPRFRGPRPPFEGPHAYGPRPPFMGRDGPPCDDTYSETDGSPYDDQYTETGGPPFDDQYSETDGPLYDDQYSETDGPPYDDSYSKMDGPPSFRGPPGSCGPPHRFRGPRPDGPPCDAPYSGPDGPPPFRGPPGSCGPPHRFRGPRPHGPPCDAPYSGTDGPPPFRDRPGPCGPPDRFRGPRPGVPPRGPPPRLRGPCPRPGGPPCDVPYSGPDGPPQRFRGPRPPFRGPCPRPRGPPPFRGPFPGPGGPRLGGPSIETPLLSYPEAEEQSGVDAGQDWTGSNETEARTAELTADPTKAESTEQPTPPGSLADSTSQQANSTGVTPKKTLLATPVLQPTNYDVPPPGTEPAYDAYWSQQQGAHSGYSGTYWSEQQTPPPGWVPPQGGPPPYGPPPTGPPPRGPGPMIPGPQGPNAPPPNWYSQSHMQGGPGGWGYPPTPQQWQQPYWYGSNYDYYNYYQWYYSYYGQSQQYPSATWPPNEWSVAANSLAAAAAVTSVSTSTSTAVTSTKAEVVSKLVVSTVSNRPMSSIPLPIPEPAVSVAVTSWPPTAPSQTVTSWPPPPPPTHQKPAVITAAPKPVHSVARPTRPLAPPQPETKPATPVAMPQTVPAAPAVTFVAQTSTLPKTAGDSRVEKQKKQLYIFNLPQDTSLTEVKALVAKYGKVLDCAVADDQGRAGLLAIVTMETVAGATICCTGLRNYRFKGRQLEVRRATMRKSEDSAQPNITEEAESSSGVTSSSEAKLPDTGVTSSDGSAADTRKQASMWVGNLPPGTKAKDVLDLLNPHGKVINCKIGASKGKSDLFAMVVMETSSDISQCISKLHGSEFQGQKLQLKKLKQKSSGTKKAE